MGIVLISCASVRTRTSTNKDNENSKKTSSKIAKNSKTKPSKFVQNSSSTVKDRFSDTTYIYLSDEVEPTNEVDSKNSERETPNADIYTKALEKYNRSEYNSACNDFKSFLEKYNDKDEVYYDAKYHLAECLVLNKSFDEAIDLFSIILSSQNVPNEIIQQTLVRMGQVYCMQNKMSLAQRNFERLKNEFPDSKYLPLATCE